MAMAGECMREFQVNSYDILLHCERMRFISMAINIKAMVELHIALY